MDRIPDGVDEADLYNNSTKGCGGVTPKEKSSTKSSGKIHTTADESKSASKSGSKHFTLAEAPLYVSLYAENETCPPGVLKTSSCSVERKDGLAPIENGNPTSDTYSSNTAFDPE